MHASTFPLLWWFYDDDDDTAHCLLNLLQKFFNLPEIKIVHTSDTILLGSLYPEKIILQVIIRASVLNPSAGNLLWYSTIQR